MRRARLSLIVENGSIHRPHPVGHALAMLVPVYGQLRAYAHFREIDARLAHAGSAVRVDARVMVALFTLSLISAVAAFVAPGLGAQAGVLVSLALLAYVVATTQRALNAYWALRDAAIERRTLVIEALALLGFGLIFVVWLFVAGLNRR